MRAVVDSDKQLYPLSHLISPTTINLNFLLNGVIIEEQNMSLLGVIYIKYFKIMLIDDSKDIENSDTCKIVLMDISVLFHKFYFRIMLY